MKTAINFYSYHEIKIKIARGLEPCFKRNIRVVVPFTSHTPWLNILNFIFYNNSHKMEIERTNEQP